MSRRLPALRSSTAREPAAQTTQARLRTANGSKPTPCRARGSPSAISVESMSNRTRALQMVEASGREHRMSLARGIIHARIWAPPKLFFVNTPSATAIDLGCEYTLQVDDGGAGQIRVTLGWVSFEGNGRASYIPEGAVGATRPGAGPGTPYYDDAPSGYGEALEVHRLRVAETIRAARMRSIWSSHRRDAATPSPCGICCTRGTLAERGRVYDRLATLVPPPARATRDAILQGDRQALDQWWDSLGLGSTTWWKLWKSRRSLDAPIAQCS